MTGDDADNLPPDPLPKMIPGGVNFSPGEPETFGETAGPMTLGADGAYHGPAVIRFMKHPPHEHDDYILRPHKIEWAFCRVLLRAARL